VKNPFAKISSKKFVRRSKYNDLVEAGASTTQLLVEARAETTQLLDLILQENGGGDAVSRGQLKQDIIALALCGFKRDGYFVEFGAANGVMLSNTHLLEKSFGWTGILSEPMPDYHDGLRKNRQCIIDTRCVWAKSGETITFLAAEFGLLSTIATFVNSDMHAHRRKNGREILVETVTLGDLLKQHDAPKFIDFLSVDTEGSELDILSCFPFDDYKFKFICIEHNHTENREKIRELMAQNGYRSLFNALSQSDDFFIAA
jgi:FkbM family methyltransferase